VRYWGGPSAPGAAEKSQYRGLFNEPGGLTVPGAPTGCNAVPAFVTPGDASNDVKCLVSWTAATTGGAVASYSVYRGGALLASGITSLSYADVAVSNNEAHIYTIKAVNAAGSSGFSNEGKAKTPTVPPTALAADLENGALAVAWTAPSGAVAYNLSSAAGDLSSFGVLAAGLGSPGYSSSGFAAGVINYFRATALNTLSGYNTIESKPSIADAALWLGAPEVLAHWGEERNDNTKPRSRHLRIIDISIAEPSAAGGYVAPLGCAGRLCPAGGAPEDRIGGAAMAVAGGALAVTLTEYPLTPDVERLDYFAMTPGELFAYVRVTVGSPVGLAAKVITSLCATFEIPRYVTGRRTYYNPATRELINERSPTRAALGTIWLKLRGTRRDWRTLAGRLYRDLPKRRKHS
jgi:hypothetical protein